MVSMAIPSFWMHFPAKQLGGKIYMHSLTQHWDRIINIHIRCEGFAFWLQFEHRRLIRSHFEMWFTSLFARPRTIQWKTRKTFIYCNREIACFLSRCHQKIKTPLRIPKRNISCWYAWCSQGGNKHHLYMSCIAYKLTSTLSAHVIWCDFKDRLFEH